MKVIKQIKQPVFFAGAIGLSIFMLFFVIAATWIGFDVKSKCREAKDEYGGDCTEALMNLLNDKNRGFRRALPVLQSYYTGNIPPRKPLDEAISQYELKKAINLTSGGANITAIFWR